LYICYSLQLPNTSAIFNVFIIGNTFDDIVSGGTVAVQRWSANLQDLGCPSPLGRILLGWRV